MTMDADPHQAHRPFGRVCIYRRERASFVCKECTVNLSFKGYDISVTTVQFYPYNVKVTLDQK